MSKLFELVVECASLESIKSDLWNNRNVAGYVNLTDELGCTPLMWADNPEVFALLLDAGTDIAIKNQNGQRVTDILEWRKEYSVKLQGNKKSTQTLKDIAKMENLLKDYKRNHPEIFGWHYEKSCSFEGD